MQLTYQLGLSEQRSSYQLGNRALFVR